jgi:dTDP-4-dehydrorhamnose 3,5-epimerase
MNFAPTRLPDVVLIEPSAFADARGFFMETWQARKFATGGIHASFVQDNHSASQQWVLRGLHYQLRQPQGKLVRVVQGEVFDVAVDMRKSSPTFGQWMAQRLSSANRLMLWIPPGFAHGFLTLSEHAEFIYKCTDYYDPASERTLIWNDPDIGIEWPMPAGLQPLISAKDLAGSRLAEAECYP